MGFVERPQRVWWRRVLFQVHLWSGIILGLYMIAIGVSGSILVFRDELAALTYPNLMRVKTAGATQAKLPDFVENARGTFPEYKLVSAFERGVYGESFFAYMERGEDGGIYVFGREDGQVLGSLDPKESWLSWMAELHYRLFAGQTGFVLNGAGAGCLVLLSATGMVLWWPGIRTWPRALTVNFRKSWKRINFDLHSATGFWILPLILMWGISGVYFVWPKTVERAVNWISPVAAGIEPEFAVTAPQGLEVNLNDVLAEAESAAPGTRLSGFYIPASGKSAMVVYQARREVQNYAEMDRVYFDPASGARLGIWHAGVNPTLGSKFVYWLGPLHFGMYWGAGVKAVWALLGLSLPALTVTGALMYWNRSLSKLWRRRKEAEAGRISATQAEAHAAE